ncbi:MAG: hypothetical protein ACUVQ8_02350 [Nitrososphaeria archaeon]
MPHSKKFSEKVRDFLMEYTGDVYNIVEDKDTLRKFGVVWNISVPMDYRAKGAVGGVSENLDHEVVVYPHLSFDLQGAAFDLDGADMQSREFFEFLGVKPGEDTVLVSVKDLKDRSRWSELEKRLPWTIRYLRMMDELAKEYSLRYGVNIVFHVGYRDWLECRDYAHFTAYTTMNEEKKFELVQKNVIVYTEYSKEHDRRWERLREEREIALKQL